VKKNELEARILEIEERLALLEIQRDSKTILPPTHSYCYQCNSLMPIEHNPNHFPFEKNWDQLRSIPCAVCGGYGTHNCGGMTADWAWRPEQGAQWISPQAGIASDGCVTNGPMATIKD